MQSELDTIAAIATPFGRGGIGIVRISGQTAIEIANQIFKSAKAASKGSKGPVFSGPSHRLHYGHIYDHRGHIVDETLVAVMHAPKTYTREDIVEIQSHSGFSVLQRILALVLEKGARLAEPGEFTKRAFLNGRIDLTQAEAVVDIINAKSEQSLQLATQHLSGDFRVLLHSWLEALGDMHALSEASIDFTEDMDADLNSLEIFAGLDALIEEIQTSIRNHEEKNLYREGARLTVVGAPNVGKSSLLNCLLERERAIVTPIPGTTRDIIEDSVVINGIPVSLADTAGIHNTVDTVERIGIERAYGQIQRSDLVIFMIEALHGIRPLDLEILEKLHREEVVIAINKIDLCNGEQDIKALVQQFLPRSAIPVSAKESIGIGQLKRAIFEILSRGEGFEDNPGLIPNQRHAQLLKIAEEELMEAKNINQKDCAVPMELVSLHLQTAKGALEEIIGINQSEDVLDRVFSQFCIGK